METRSSWCGDETVSAPHMYPYISYRRYIMDSSVQQVMTQAMQIQRIEGVYNPTLWQANLSRLVGTCIAIPMSHFGKQSQNTPGRMHSK